MSEKLLIERLKSLAAEVHGPVKEALLDSAMALTEADALAARLADAVRLLEGWHTAYHADAGMEGLDDDTTTWLAGISPFTPDSADVLRTPDDPLSPHYDPTHTATVDGVKP